ncbi:MAG: D-alanyl-D-alanine carboxypeptidase/D-alanyl-D-alanine-endopeptidase, partial [Ignavibacteria bacterium]
FERSIDSTLLSDINKDSDNLRSEMLLYALALNDSGVPAAIENGIEALNKLVDTLGFNRDDYSFADGSGVSRYNLISSELVMELLKFMYKEEHFEIFYNSLAIAGIDGTLEKRMIGAPAENNLHAKTGTLSGVSTLSGYVNAKNNHLLAFSILVQNYVEKSSFVRKIQDRICEVIANYK